MKCKTAFILFIIMLTFAIFPKGAAKPAYADAPADYKTHIGDTKINPDSTAPDPISDRAKSAPRYDLNSDFSMIPVLISVGKVTGVKLNLHGNYYIENNMLPIITDYDMNCTLIISAASGKITVAKGSKVLYCGSTVTVSRVALNSSAGWAQLLTTGNERTNGEKYLGNFKFSVNGKGFVEMINIVPVVHYLYGIIPFEMSESNEPEALIAQAVTSKTYGFAFPYYKDEEYVITDSFTYQGYRGYKAGRGCPKCMQACIDACGKILTCSDELILTFYGATDGGETDLPSNVFGTSDIDYAYEIKLDNPDFEYTPKKRQTLEITYGLPPDNAEFAALLNEQVLNAIGRQAEIISVTDCSLNTPRHEGSVRNLTKMDVKMNILDGETESELTVSFDAELLKEKGIFTKNYEIYWGERTETGYKVYFCRWGHGLGLSQYGAQARAVRGECSDAILSFYFSKFVLNSVKEKNPEEPFSYNLSITAYGNVRANNYVNMRSGPSIDFERIAKIPAGTHLDIIGETEDWLICIADGMLGYIRGDYVNVLFFPAPENAQARCGSGKINENVKMRVSPSKYSGSLLTLNGGEDITVENEIGGWYYINYDGKRGFVPMGSVNIDLWKDIDLHKSFMLNAN